MGERTVTNPGRGLSRLGLAGLIFLAAVLLSGCPAQSPVDGRCPNAEAIASSIDWIGDGTPQRRTYGDKTGTSDRPCKIEVYFEASDGVELERQVEDRLKSFPSVFTVEEDTKFGVRFVADDWVAAVVVSGDDDAPDEIAIVVEVADDDAHASEILAPIVDVLGTVPDQ